MMDKLLTFSGYDPRSGPHIFRLEPDIERSVKMIKMARALPPRIEEYIRSAKPIPGKAQLLIDALGAGEYWGSNVNGDFFPEEALRHEGPEYGYETFMHFAHPFKHHVNKDPALAYGDKVTLSAYDPGMHRVLLVVSVDKKKCHDILQDLSHGRYWDVSMGCKVPWDECSECHNRARNRAEYCDHLRQQMNKILPNGKRVFAFNRKPKFFDISFVLIGAEKASHVLQKVAFQGSHEIVGSAEAWERYTVKVAAQKTGDEKMADITKEVPSNQPRPNIHPISPEAKEELTGVMDAAGDAKAHEAEIPPAILDQLGGFPLQEVFHTLAALGIDLRPQEFQRIVLVKMGQRALLQKLAQHRLVFDERRLATTAPAWARSYAKFDPGSLNEKVASVMRPYLEERSCLPDILAARLERLEKRAGGLGRLEDGTEYQRDSQWYPMTDAQRAASSGRNKMLPASMALATGYLIFKRLFPQLAETGPAPIRLLAKSPWLLPLLLGAGVGASVGLSGLMAPQQIENHGTGRGLDAKMAAVYDESKTASIKSPFVRLGLIPLAYLYAGVQQRRWERGEKLNAVDRFVASRPDVTALAAFAAAPQVAAGLKGLTKKGGVMNDVALYTVGSESKLLPAVMAGALADSLIFRRLQRLASRRGKGTDHADAR
jgi:hypothetical protein